MVKGAGRSASAGPKHLLGFATLALVLSAGACGVAPADVTVALTNQLSFEPKQVTISVGQTVEWRNSSLLVHTVTGDPDKATLPGSATLPDGAEPFDSGSLEPEGNFRHMFTVPGTYKYFCTPHEVTAMVGQVVVRTTPSADLSLARVSVCCAAYGTAVRVP